MAADCNCSNPSCPCYKGNQDKADEQQAPGPDASPQNESENYPDEYPDEQRVPWETVSPDATSHVNSGAGTTQSTNGSTHGGSAMTAPAGNAEAGVTIGALEQAYNAELASATSFMDQMTSTAEDRKQAASNFDNVVGQLSSARHDPETINEAAAVSEALRAVAQQCEQAKTASDAAVAALNAAIKGISRHNLAREYAGSVQSGASVDAFRE